MLFFVFFRKGVGEEVGSVEKGVRSNTAIRSAKKDGAGRLAGILVEKTRV